MHYNRFQGSKNGKPTMAAIGNENLELGNNLGLTPTDILRINRLYECESKIPFISMNISFMIEVIHINTTMHT